jgi:hypothetical protein
MSCVTKCASKGYLSQVAQPFRRWGQRRLSVAEVKKDPPGETPGGPTGQSLCPTEVDFVTAYSLEATP